MSVEKDASRKILMLLSNAFDPDPRVHREAKALVDAGYDVTIIGWDRDRKVVSCEIVDGIRVERIYVNSTHGRGSTQMFFLLLFWIKAFFACINRKIDVVYAHDFDTLPVGFLLAKLKRRRLVYDTHESYVDMVHWLPKLIRSAIVCCENFIMKRTDLVITVGDLLKQHLLSRGANNVCIVGNWQDPEKFIFDDAIISEEKKRLGIRSGQKVICFIANLGNERKIPEIIEAVASMEDYFLILGGNGTCAVLAKEASLKFNNITYLGYVASSKVPLYTAIADIIFYGFDQDNPNARFSAPNKLFESLAAGKPIVTGSFGEIGKIVKEADCGIVIHDYKPRSLIAALKGVELNELLRYGANAKSAALRRYTWKAASDSLLQGCNSLFVK